MPKYMKAYELSRLRRFPGWHERRWRPEGETDAEDGQEGRPALGDKDVVYLHEDLRVTRDVFGDGDVIFEDQTPEWARYCAEELGFQVPDWEQEAAQARKALENAQGGGVEAS